MNSGENLRLAASTAVLVNLLSTSGHSGNGTFARRETDTPEINSDISRAPGRSHDDHGVREIDAAIVAQGQRGLVHIPATVARGCPSFFQSRRRAPGKPWDFRVHAIEVLLVSIGRSFRDKISRRDRSIRDFVECWNSAQVNLYDRVGIAKEDFGGGLNDAGLPDPVDPKTASCRWAGWAGSCRQKNLVQTTHATNRPRSCPRCAR